MTKKHFQRFAEILGNAYKDHPESEKVINQIENCMITYFQEINSLFDDIRFHEAVKKTWNN